MGNMRAPAIRSCGFSGCVRQLRGHLGVATPDMVGEGVLVKRPMVVNPLLGPLPAGHGVIEPATRRQAQGPETKISPRQSRVPFSCTLR